MNAHTRPRLELSVSGTLVQHLDHADQLPAAIALAEQIGAGHRAHLLRARRAGRIALYEVFRETSASTFKRLAAVTRRHATLVVVGGDDGRHDGPEAWPLAIRMIRWARAVVLHGSGAEVWHYELAIEGAELHRTALLIECEAAALGAWQELIVAHSRDVALIKIVPHGEHPVANEREPLQ
jgi:hypothetical protein